MRRILEFLFGVIPPFVVFSPAMVLFINIGLTVCIGGFSLALTGEQTWGAYFAAVAGWLPRILFLGVTYVSILSLGVIIIMGEQRLSRNKTLIKIFFIIGMIGWLVGILFFGVSIHGFISRLEPPNIFIVFFLGPLWVGGRYLWFMLKQLN